MSFTVIILPLKNPTSYLKNTNEVSLALGNTRSFCWSGCFQGPLGKVLLYFLAGRASGHAAKTSEGPGLEPLTPHLCHTGTAFQGSLYPKEEAPVCD